MFLRANTCMKDGKVHRYWSVVESRRTTDDRLLQRQVLYLGEINDSQKAAWTRAIEVFAEASHARQVAIFPDDRLAPELDCEVVQIRLSELALHRTRHWGGAGWPSSCGNSLIWMDSGRHESPRVGRKRAG
jgi:hypothetical protein